MAVTQDLVIGVDASTTACKAVVWDLHGQPLGAGRAGLTIQMPQPGWHEQQAESWWKALTLALHRAMGTIEPRRLAGVAIAHQRETFVPVDAAGKALRPGILWMDERASGVLPALEASLGRGPFHRLTGKPLSANLTVVKIIWLREQEPGIFARAAGFLDVNAYIIRRLTGQACTSWGSADPTGLFDVAAHDWCDPILAAAGITRDQLPRLVPPGELCGRITRRSSLITGLPEGLPVFAGLGDGQAGGLGANICASGSAYLALGTSVISGTYAAEPVIDLAFRTMTGGISGSFMLETVLLGGSYTLDWVMQTFLGKRGKNLVRYRDRLEASLDQIPPGAQGLVVVPYWNSVMNPYWDASASGIVAGWHGGIRPEHFYRAILEGISMELRLHFQGVEAVLGFSIDRVMAMGGGSHSDRWMQIIADVTGKTIYRAEPVETTALGAGILAASGAGLFPSVQQAAQAMSARPAASFQPDPQRHDFYIRLYEQVYRGLYPSIRLPLQKLANMKYLDIEK